MTVGMFAPRSPDGRSEWRIVMDLFLKVPKGGVVTFDQLASALQRDRDLERHALYAAVGRAGRELRATHSRSIASVPTVGYRVLEASEHEVQAYSYQRQAGRKLGNAVAVLRATPLDDLTPQQRQRTLAATNVMVHLVSAVGQVARRLRKQEAAIQTLESRVGALEDASTQQLAQIEDAEVIDGAPQPSTQSAPVQSSPPVQQAGAPSPPSDDTPTP